MAMYLVDTNVMLAASAVSELSNQAVRSIQYYTERLAKEGSRVDESNEWIDQLYKSLGIKQH